jgi:hypothetical protein
MTEAIIAPIRSEKTAQLYEKHLARLTSLALDLTKPEGVIAWLDSAELSNSSKKSYLAAILSATPKGTPLYDTYGKKMKSYSTVIKEQERLQTATPKQDEKWLSWDDICKARDKARPETPEDFAALQEWVILCLYTMMEAPLRADYANMAVVENHPADKNKDNYIIVNEKEAIVVLNHYKSFRKWGRVEFPVPTPLYDILYEWTQFYNPTGWLLVKGSGEPMDEGNLSQRVIRTLERITGVPSGISMIRHAFRTMKDKGEKSILEKEKWARAMLHTPAVAETYRFLDKE